MNILISAMMYLLVFASSAALFKKAEKRKKAEKKYKLLIGLSILIICVFSAMRNFSVGTDTYHYQSIFQHIGSRLDIKYALEYGNRTGLEPGFCVFTTIIGSLFKEFRIYLFIFNLFLIIPVYFIADRLSNDINPVAVLMTYFFMFFNMSLNISRQSLAASIIMIAFIELKEKKYVWFVLCSLIACSFHTTAIIGVIGCMACIMYLKNNSSKSFFISLTIMIAIVLAYSSNLIPYLAEVMIRNDIMDLSRSQVFMNLFDRTSTDNNVYESSKGISFYLIIILRLFIYFLPCVFSNKKERTEIQNSASVISLYGVIIFVLGSLAYGSIYVYRLTIYLDYFSMLFFSVMWKSDADSNNDLKAVNERVLTMNIGLLIYWYLMYIQINLHGTNNLFG